MRKFTITFEMDEKTEKLFLQSALERVINTSMRIVDLADADDDSINLSDWEEWKPIVVTFWIAMHDAVIRARHSMPPSENNFTLIKGD